MNRSVQQLQYALQTLALPVTAQLRLHAREGCRVDEMAAIFNRSQKQARQALKEQLTGDQAVILNQLENKLWFLVNSQYKPAWQDADLRGSADWRQIRNLARQALARFDWPLDVPPVAHAK